MAKLVTLGNHEVTVKYIDGSVDFYEATLAYARYFLDNTDFGPELAVAYITGPDKKVVAERQGTTDQARAWLMTMAAEGDRRW
jgi:hypothetical protein